MLEKLLCRVVSFTAMFGSSHNTFCLTDCVHLCDQLALCVYCDKSIGIKKELNPTGLIYSSDMADSIVLLLRYGGCDVIFSHSIVT